MNWREVTRHNARRSARKAKREAAATARKAFIEKAGGPVTVAELKAATRRVERGGGNRIIDCDVWTLRGADWVLGYFDGETWQAFAPFVSWRMDGHEGKYVPMTPGAKKWLDATLKAEAEGQP